MTHIGIFQLTRPFSYAIQHLMYIKKVRKSNPGSKKVYEYLHLVENVRTSNGPRQRLILNLGRLDIPSEQYKELANCIEGFLTGQTNLFGTTPVIEKHARKVAEKIKEKRSKEYFSSSEQNAEEDFKLVNVNSMDASQTRSLGPEYVCHCQFNELHINEILLQNGITAGALPLMEALVVGRLVSPGSELHTWGWAQQQSAIFELTGNPLRPSLNSMYRAGDRLFKLKDTPRNSTNSSISRSRI